jgi:hypothetical protein
MYSTFRAFVGTRVAVTYHVPGGFTVSVGTVYDLNDLRLTLRTADRAVVIRLPDVVHVAHLPVLSEPSETPTLPLDAWKEAPTR